MEVFPRKLAESIGLDHIHLNAGIESITKTAEGFSITVNKDGAREQMTARRVVCALPADGLAGIINTMNPEAAKVIKNVLYPPVAVVFMGFEASQVQRPLDGFGFLIPEKEQKSILGSIWSSTIFPDRAPEGHVAFTTFVGGTRQPDHAGLPESELKDMVLSDLKEIVGLSGQPHLTRIMKWPRAIPQYTVGYGAVQQLYDELEKEFSGLYIAGNIRKGISVGDSVLCAHETVERISN
jgi:oxygen-dependent protoporphyrinogen oxidase